MRTLALHNGKLKEDISLNQVTAILNKKGIVWIDLEKPTQKQMKELQKIFDLHSLTIEDCLGAVQLPKIDEYEKHAFLSINQIHLDGTSIHLGGVYFYLGSNYLISIHKERSPSMDELYSKLLKNPDVLKRGSDFIAYQVIDKITDKYLEVLETIEKDVQNLETRVLRGKIDRSLHDIIKTRRLLSNFKKSLMPQRDLLLKLARRDTRFVKSSHLMYFRDITDQVVRGLTIIDSLREIITGTFEAYLSIHSNRLNEIMKTLTIIATIFLPLTFLTGVYGMNFKLFPELEWEHGYFAFWAISALIVIIMVAYFKKRGYV